jgi:Leucine-rich repeat (LRR) protein
MTLNRDPFRSLFDDPSLQPLQRLLENAPEEFRDIREGVHEAWKLAKHHPGMGLTLIRQQLEFVIGKVSRSVPRHRTDSGPTKPESLRESIRRLIVDGFLPRRLEPYASAVRKAGNRGAHRRKETVTLADVTNSLLNLMPILAWYFEGARPDVHFPPTEEGERGKGRAGSAWVIAVEIPGELFAGFANGAESAWTSVRKTPGKWVFREGEVCRLRVDPSVCESALAGLGSLWGLSGFQALDLSHCSGVTNASLAHLRGLTDLRALDLSSTPVTDAGLVALRGLTNLQRLNLAGCEEVTDVGLAHVGRLKDLHSLDLHGCSEIKGPGLEHLWNCLKLRSLDVIDTCVFGEDLVYLRGFANLQSLRVGHGKEIRFLLLGLGVKEGLMHLRELKSLRELQIESYWLEGEELAHLGGLVNLRSLDLSNIGSEPGFLSHLPTLPSLRSFTPPKTCDKPGLSCLRRMPNLQELDLGYGGSLTDEGLACVGELKHLHTLFLNDTEWPLPIPLGRLTNLQSLHLTRCYYFDDEDLADLQGLTKLEFLDMGSTRVSNEGLPSLRGLTNLQYLGLSDTAVTDAGLAHLQGFTGLRTLDLWGCLVTATGLDLLHAALPRCSILVPSRTA